MATKPKIKTAAQQHVPADRDACAAQIATIGTLQREVTMMTAQMNEAIAAITARFQPELDARSARITELSAGVQTWCEANRATLTEDGKVKFHEFLTGQVKWRTGLPSVTVTGVEAVIKTLKTLGMGVYVRTKEEVDKEAVLATYSAAARITAHEISVEPDPERRAELQRAQLHHEMLQGLSGLRVKPGAESFSIEPLSIEPAEVVS